MARSRTAESTIVLALLLFLVTPADAGSVDTHEGVTLLTGKLTGRGDAEALFIFDHHEQKLAIYDVSGDTLKLLFVRNCT